MTYRHHGLMSMVLFSIAMLLALVVIARQGAWLGVAAVVVANLLSTVGIAYSYCAKCACRAEKCSHFVIGMVANYLPKRAQGPYTLVDYAGMFLSAGISFAAPVIWLWSQPLWLAAFLVIGGLGALEIVLAVCPSCTNSRCPAAQWHRRFFPQQQAEPLENVPADVEQ